MKVGVVHPTRNRPDLAVEGVRAVLRIPSVDVVVLSDNSTDAAACEEIRAGCEAIGDDRVAYVRPPEPMDVSAHWDWAIGHTLATTDITHLVVATDRYRLRPAAFDDAVRLARGDPETPLTFAYDSVWDQASPVGLERRPWSGLVLYVRTGRLVETLSRVILHIVAPQLWNAITPREVLDRVRGRFGTFVGRFPDMSFGYRFCATEDAVRYYDRTCQYHFAYGRSGGWGLHDGALSQAARELVDQVASSDPAAFVPELASTLYGVAAYEYNLVRSAVGGFPAIDRTGYLEQESRHAAMLTDSGAKQARFDLLRELGWRGEMPAGRAEVPTFDSAQAAMEAVESQDSEPTLSLHHLADVLDEVGHLIGERA